MHRLTQAVIRTRLTPAQAAAARAQAATLLTASHPGDTGLPSTWPGWARLLPHLLALDPEASTETLGNLTYDAVWYLLRRGQPGDALDLARRLHQHRHARNGPDDQQTMKAASALGVALSETGRYAEARDLLEDGFTRYRRVLGEDHPGTLISASNLAADLRALGETGDGSGT